MLPSSGVLSRGQQLGKTQLVTVRVLDVEVSLTPYPILRCHLWGHAFLQQLVIERIHTFDPQDDPAPPALSPASSLDQINEPGTCSKAGKTRILASID